MVPISDWGSESKPGTRQWDGSASRDATTMRRWGRQRTRLPAQRQRRGGSDPGGPEVFAAVEETVVIHPVGSLDLKGFGRPIQAHEVRGLRGEPDR